MNLNFLRVTILAGLFLIQIGDVCADKAGDFKFADISSPDFFPILPWSRFHGSKPPFVERDTNAMDGIADCHFNVAGFVLPRDLPLCWRHRLGAIMFPSDPAFTLHAYVREWKTLSDAEIERRVKLMVDTAGKAPPVCGYFIMDEPSVADFPALAKAVAAVRKFAPGKFAYINLFPDYATIGANDKSQLGTSNYTEYLERFVLEVKPHFISYDNYTVQTSNDLKDAAKAASYYRNLLEVRRVALSHQLPYLNIVSANQIRPYTPIPSPANLLFQAYTTVAAGYRGVGWYTYFGDGYKYAPAEASGKKTVTWGYLAEVNRQVAALAPVLSKLVSTGVYFSAPTPVPGLPELPGKLVTSVACRNSVMVGEFQSRDGESFAMVVNLSLERSAKFTLQTKTATPSIELISAADGMPTTFDATNGLWLVAGQGALLKLGK